MSADDFDTQTSTDGTECVQLFLLQSGHVLLGIIVHTMIFVNLIYIGLSCIPDYDQSVFGVHVPTEYGLKSATHILLTIDLLDMFVDYQISYQYIFLYIFHSHKIVFFNVYLKTDIPYLAILLSFKFILHLQFIISY